MPQQPEDSQLTQAEARPYEPPRFEILDLACEISAYAPDGGPPLL